MSINGLTNVANAQAPLHLATASVAAKVDRDGDHDNNAPDPKPASALSNGRPLNLVA
jgi:hypothetical protein